MNWEAIGAIGETVGAIAVVATIIYLARQVRDNSRQVKINTTQSYASLVQDGFAPIYNSQETIKIWHQGQTNPDSLDEVELKTYFLFMDRLMNNVIPLLNHRREGVISETEYLHYKAAYLDIVGTVGGALWEAEQHMQFNSVLGELRET